MKLLILLREFLKIGLFAFGGAYGAVPLIREAVLDHGWLEEAGFMNLLGISESTPGPIMVNAATMIGFSQAGVGGAALATLGVILPSFLIMLAVPRLRERWRGRPWMRRSMRGVKPCVAGVIAATGIHAMLRMLAFAGEGVCWRGALIASALSLGAIAYRRVCKASLPPIWLLLLGAALGALAPTL